MFAVFQVFHTNPAPRRLPIWPQALTSQARGTQLVMTQSVTLEDASVDSARTSRHNSYKSSKLRSRGTGTRTWRPERRSPPGRVSQNQESG